MGKGQTLVTRLSLPADASPDQLQRNLTRWSDALPFGAFGFTVTRSNNGANILDTALGVLSWNQVVNNAESWCSAGTGAEQSTFYCPQGGAGWFVASTEVWIGATPRDTWLLAIRRVLLDGTIDPVISARATSLEDRLALSTPVRLADGEGIQVALFNDSGATIVPTYNAIDTMSPQLPIFHCYRISLL